MTSGLTQLLGAFVASVDADALPEEAIAAVRRGIADCVGVAHAGNAEPVVEQALASITSLRAGAMGADTSVDEGADSWAVRDPRSDARLARIWTTPAHAAACDAAFVNAVAGHALDFDDTGLDGHPSVILAPVALAEAERLGLNWRHAVAAYVAGYEVWAELRGRDADKHHGKGWHPTAVFGAVASAAASAWLRRLPAGQASHALAIAASMAAGLVANFGSMMKPLQVGLAGRNGILAASWAEHGVTAAADALESPRGFLAAISPSGRLQRDGPSCAGAPWRIVIEGISIKRYPVCYAAHRIADAAVTLHARLGARVDEVDEITAELGELQAAMLRASRPETGLDAKFSAQFIVACALLRGHVDLADLADAEVRDPAIQALLRRVRVVALAERDSDDPLFSPADRLTVRLRDGQRIEAEPVRRALGHACRPIGTGELRRKFEGCASGLGDDTVGRWWASVTAPLDAPVRWP